MGVATGIVALAMMLVISYDVVMRYFFNQPIRGGTQITEYLLLLFTMLGIAWVLKEDAHVRVDVILVRLNTKTQAIINCVTSFVAMFACGFFIQKSIEIAMDFYRRGAEATAILASPLWVFYVLIAFGVSLLCIEFGRKTVQYWHAARQAGG